MKTFSILLLDALAAVALLIAGLGSHSALHLPSWSVGLFALPFLLYLHYRLAISFRFILGFIVIFTAASLAFTFLLPPPDHFTYSRAFLVIVLLAILAMKLWSTRNRCSSQ